MSFTPISGKNGSVLVGSVPYLFKKWTYDMKTDTPDVSNFGGGGYRQFVSGLTTGDITLEGPYDESNMPLTSGNTYTLTLHWDNSTTLSGTAICNNISPSQDVEDAGRIKATFKVNGTFTAAIV